MTQVVFCLIGGHGFVRAPDGQPARKIVVEGRHGMICEDCVTLCVDLIAQARRTGTPNAVVLKGAGQ